MGRTEGARTLKPMERATIIAERNLGISTIKRIAQAHGIAENSVYSIASKASPEVLALVPVAEQKLTERLGTLQQKTLTRIDEALDRTDSPLTQLATTFGILYDKKRLEDGQSTSNVAVLTGEQAYLKAFLAMREKGIDVNDVLDAMRLADIPGVDDAAKAAGERAVRLIAGIEESS